MNKRFLGQWAGRAVAIGGTALATMGSAHAALPSGFSDAVTAYGADVASGIGLLIAAGIVVYASKKLGQKLGLL
jgi:hypothetical protein